LIRADFGCSREHLADHVIIIVKENHTFDNYFGPFPWAVAVTLP
jgi:phospholipase C